MRLSHLSSITFPVLLSRLSASMAFVRRVGFGKSFESSFLLSLLLVLGFVLLAGCQSSAVSPFNQVTTTPLGYTISEVKTLTLQDGLP